MTTRKRAAVVSLAALLALTACSDEPGKATGGSSADAGRAESAAQPKAVAAQTQPASPPAVPASAAGGACSLLDYAGVASALGVQFHVAVAGGTAQAQTCVLKQSDSRYPDLTLAVAPTKADAKVYASTVTPKGSAPVSGLGKSAYSRALAPAGPAGAGIEVGWLSANGRMLTVQFTLPAGGDAAAAGGLTPKLVDLAKQVDAKK
ncbi:hypothetical protein [Longispora albida]|uniref:hypothetical protein n=1 Tax=Longispora albida TaxID=203523 RepID=UPI00036A3C24|nr:hypothetical protein [Longispora albida]